MAVSEDEVVDVGMRLQILACKAHEAFFLFALIGGFAFFLVGLAAVLCPVESEVDEPSGMDGFGATAEQGAFEASKHEARFPVVGCAVVAVSVGEEKLFSAEFDGAGFAVEDDAAFGGEVVAHPHVVVADEEVYLHAAVGQFADLAEEAGETAGDDVAVFKPEVEHVAEHEHGFGLVLDVVEKTDEPSFLCAAVLQCAAAEVGVGDEVVVFHD